jgi:hypothetical protein
MNEPNNKLGFVIGKPFHSSVIRHSNLVDPFVSYEENEGPNKLEYLLFAGISMRCFVTLFLNGLILKL